MDIPYEILITVATAVTTFFKSFKFVQEGEKGVKLRFGRAVKNSEGKPKIIEPGFAFLIPFVETLKRHHVRQQSYRFQEQRIMLKDGLIFLASGMIVFKVDDIYKALFEIVDLDSSVDDIGMAAVREEIQQLTHADIHNLDQISARLVERVRRRGEEWGIHFLQFSLTNFAPTPETANLLNASIGVKFRGNALKEFCQEEKIPLIGIDPNFAAALIGIPLVTTLPSNNLHFQAERKEVKEEKGLFDTSDDK